MTLDEWAHARRADILAREHENSLRVGPAKPLGGRGFAPSFAGVRDIWRDIVAARRAAGHRPVRFLQGGAAGGLAWLYAYDVIAMRDLVVDRLFLLRSLGWPTESDDIVARIRDELVPPRSELYAFIADCYGDKLNPGRADVMPSCARVDLLQAYLDAHGEPDPSFIYFAKAHMPIPESYDAFLPPGVR